MYPPLTPSGPLLGFLLIIFLSAGILLQFLVILSGAIEKSPENQIYFLQSSTDGIPNARNPSRWTFFSMCGVDANNHNTNCGAVVTALPFDPPNGDDFNTTVGIPPGFLGTKRYLYLSRFMFVLFLFSLFCAVFALITSLVLCRCTGSTIARLNVSLALLFQTAAAVLMTAWTVEGRDAFRKAGQTAHVGVMASAFTWLAVTCYFVAAITFCMGGSVEKDKGFMDDQQAEGFIMEPSMTRGRSPIRMEEVVASKDCAALKDTALLKDTEVLKDAAVSKDSVVSKDATVLKDDAVLEDAAVLKDAPVLKDAAVLKDVVASKDAVVLKDATVLKNDVVLKDAAVLKDAPVLKDAAVLKDAPVLKDH
jgi:hypothetical protein